MNRKLYVRRDSQTGRWGVLAWTMRGAEIVCTFDSWQAAYWFALWKVGALRNYHETSPEVPC
ncbi:hypothetical protein HPO96_37160 [Kribbella sandramycini]|uniref:Uncharacterized protein n=1 Tax=Kribbella sandramycini TaxID=60450 RepID=A0A7Y4P575_9ACTN|nr:hypothetical protein [Kribbella sandramycini]MBB6564432.1 hypothetical protein [Kribbella sandramycini]NOL45890.1 hypothetical protein [Kribbella sandramycini]